MNKLAILGGNPVRKKLFPFHNTIGHDEKVAVQKVLESGNLSTFLGTWHPDFFGGPQVQGFEKQWSSLIEVKHSIAVNSNTSGLFAAIGACQIQPGDEVIVSPYTMSASAVAPVIYGGVPVFADIDPETFCLDPKSIAEKITSRTKAILVVHIFGHPADMDPIMALAKKYNLKVIEDCAQAPYGRYKDRMVGTIGDIGVFSFNYHKHIHTGEGGMVTTNSDDLADRVRLIRNHAEAVVEAKGNEDLVNMLGFNYRMTEIEAAIGSAQLGKLPGIIAAREENAAYYRTKLSGFEGLKLPEVKFDSRHTYYLHAIRFDELKMGLKRSTFIKALQAELPSAIGRETTPIVGSGYVRPLYLQPLYQKRLAACSFNCSKYSGSVSYLRGICPVAERMHFHEVFTSEFIRESFSDEDRADVVRAFSKIFENLNLLREFEQGERS